MSTEEMNIFSVEEQNALRALVGHIIPASKDYNQPSASDPVIFRDILTSGAALRDRLAGALASLTSGQDMTLQRALAFRDAFPTEAEMIQVLVAHCYYRDDRFMRALDIEVRAPFPQGYEQEPNDLSLLYPVRARGAIYRKAD